MRYTGMTIAVGVVASILAAGLAEDVSAGSAARKIVTRIDTTGVPQGGNPTGGAGKFRLRSGAVADTGASTYSFSGTTGTLVLTGTHGELDIRMSKRETGIEVDSQGLDLWAGTWKIVGGAGTYAGAQGLGVFVGTIGPSYRVAFHLEGFRT